TSSMNTLVIVPDNDMEDDSKPDMIEIDINKRDIERSNDRAIIIETQTKEDSSKSIATMPALTPSSPVSISPSVMKQFLYYFRSAAKNQLKKQSQPSLSSDVSSRLRQALVEINKNYNVLSSTNTTAKTEVEDQQSPKSSASTCSSNV
ncbi:unnamed protein product, partial [Didymodactylos carnosus]